MFYEYIIIITIIGNDEKKYDTKKKKNFNLKNMFFFCFILKKYGTQNIWIESESLKK